MRLFVLARKSNKLHLCNFGKMFNNSQRLDFLNPNLAK